MTVITTRIRKYYEEAFNNLNGIKRIPEIDVRFYPYIGINHTIRIRDGRAYVRISEICHDLPMSAQRALAYILVARLLGKKVPPTASKVYANSIQTEEIRKRAAHAKRTRGRKIITSSKGDVYDLDRIFDTLNREYFIRPVPKPVLTWSARRTYRILGHHDSTHKTVVISRSLDDVQVPKYVVEYVLFHEMLHIAHPTVHHNGRRYNHTPAFRADEEKFAYFLEAERWIERNVRKLKRMATRERLAAKYV
jgi:hypothetical protein